GLVQVMRDVLSRPEDFGWLGTRMEMARRLRTEPDFRQRWLDRARELSSATGQRLRAQKEAGRLREDVPAEVVQVYLELVLDGLVSRLAAGYDTADRSAVLDMVGASVRRRDCPDRPSRPPKPRAGRTHMPPAPTMGAPPWWPAAIHSRLDHVVIHRSAHGADHFPTR